MKRAFTLIELLIVIGIIAVLSAILLGTFSGATESARATQCLANMKSLANAVQSYALETNHYPSAESREVVNVVINKSMVHAKKQYNEEVGWISWYSKGLYPSDSSQKESCHPVGMYSGTLEEYEYALSHGSLYKYVGGNVSVYVCPVHKDKHAIAHWSYFMNPKVGGRSYGNFKGADRMLLFGEIPFQGPGDWFPNGTADEGDTDSDAVLQYKDGTENIGGNHKSAKKWYAHVAFADGHVEKLNVDGLSGENMKELTTWLCEGKAVGRTSGGKYEELDKN